MNMNIIANLEIVDCVYIEIHGLKFDFYFVCSMFFNYSIDDWSMIFIERNYNYFFNLINFNPKNHHFLIL
jgi:hypothetical protein